MSAFHLESTTEADEIACRAHVLGGHGMRLTHMGQKENRCSC